MDSDSPHAAFDPSNWQHVGNGAAILNDARENQIARLPGGGFLLLSAGGGNIHASYGDTVEQLHERAASPTTIDNPLLSGDAHPRFSLPLPANESRLSFPYGPEIVSVVQHGNERLVTFNVSQWQYQTGHIEKDVYRTIQYTVKVH